MDGVITCVVVPIRSFADRVPLCLRAGISDTCQAGATVERTFSNARNAIRDRDTPQAGAIGERRTNACDTIRDRDNPQAGATGERIISNARDAPVGWDHAAFASCNQGFTCGFDDAISSAMVGGISTCNDYAR